jgi:hypothetical protein
MKRPQSATSAFLGLLLSFFAFVTLASIIVRALLLKFDGATVSAQVIETTETFRSMRSINSPYAVQYHFQLPGSKRWYRHQEMMLKGEPAADVTKQTWDEAKRTGMIRVVYWRHNPNVNLAADPYSLNGILCPSVAATISAVVALSCGHTLVKLIRDKRSPEKVI